MVVRATGHPRLQLFLRLSLTYLNAKSLQSLTDLFAVVADKTERCLIPLENGHLREGHDLVALVDLLVDDVPDVDVGIDVPDERMGEEIVQERFGRHELIGIDKHNDNGLLIIEQPLQLRDSLQIFHFYYRGVRTPSVRYEALSIYLSFYGGVIKCVK